MRTIVTIMKKTQADYEVLEADIRQEFPDFHVVNKSSSVLMNVIDIVLKIITFWQMNEFMTSFITTMGSTVYTPVEWDVYEVTARMEILRHERVHMRQARKYGRVLFSLMYAGLPLPTVFAYWRKKFEQEAYEVSLAAMQEYYGDAMLQDEGVRSRMITHFTSAEYFWTWPWKRSIAEWYDTTVAKLLSK